MLLLNALVQLAAESPGSGRGDNPSDAGGVLIVVGIAAAVLALAVLGLWLAARRRSGL
jgi:hypothetical protein